MNLVVITGRTTREFGMTTAKSGTLVAKNAIAVDTGFGDNKRTDYPTITAFGKTAEFCENYVRKGDLVEVVGHITTGSYQKQDGTTVYTTDVTVENIKKLSSSAKAERREEPEPRFEETNERIPF